MMFVIEPIVLTDGKRPRTLRGAPSPFPHTVIAFSDGVATDLRRARARQSVFPPRQRKHGARGHFRAVHRCSADAEVAFPIAVEIANEGIADW
jgi:hypothetical protein